MTSGANNILSPQGSLRGLPEELSLDDVRHLVQRFPSVPPAVHRWHWFSLNSLLVAAGALLLLLLSFLLTAPPAPETMPGPAVTPLALNEAAMERARPTERTGTSAPPQARTSSDQHSEGIPTQSISTTATARNAALPATLSTTGHGQALAPRNTLPQPAAAAPPTQGGSDFHVVVYTTDRRLRYVFCAKPGTLAKPGVHDEALLIRSEVIANGSFTWRAAGGKPPYRLVSSVEAVEGTNCVTVSDADGHVAEACGVIETTREAVTVNCNTIAPDTTGSHRHKNISNGACPTCPQKPAPTPHDSIAPPPDTTKVKPRDPVRGPSPGPVEDTTRTGPRPGPQTYRPPVKLPDEPPPAPPKPEPRKEPLPNLWPRTPNDPNPPLHRDPPVSTPNRVSPMPSGGNNNPPPAPPPPARYDPGPLKR